GTMAQEASTAGGFVASTAMYVAALICFVGGVWSLWQSRQPWRLPAPWCRSGRRWCRLPPWPRRTA
ncbi:MAG: hypothetical protein EOO40_10805, partial [Deltaproteobacteria bacterium]